MSRPTTRRHPRSTAEAWARTADYACAVQHAHRPTLLERIASPLLAIAIGVSLAWLAVEHLAR